MDKSETKFIEAQTYKTTVDKSKCANITNWVDLLRNISDSELKDLEEDVKAIFELDNLCSENSGCKFTAKDKELVGGLVKNLPAVIGGPFLPPWNSDMDISRIQILDTEKVDKFRAAAEKLGFPPFDIEEIVLLQYFLYYFVSKDDFQEFLRAADELGIPKYKVNQMVQMIFEKIENRVKDVILRFKPVYNTKSQEAFDNGSGSFTRDNTVNDTDMYQFIEPKDVIDFMSRSCNNAPTLIEENLSKSEEGEMVLGKTRFKKEKAREIFNNGKGPFKRE